MSITAYSISASQCTGTVEKPDIP